MTRYLSIRRLPISVRLPSKTIKFGLGELGQTAESGLLPDRQELRFVEMMHGREVVDLWQTSSHLRAEYEFQKSTGPLETSLESHVEGDSLLLASHAAGYLMGIMPWGGGEIFSKPLDSSEACWSIEEPRLPERWSRLRTYVSRIEEDEVQGIQTTSQKIAGTLHPVYRSALLLDRRARYGVDAAKVTRAHERIYEEQGFIERALRYLSLADTATRLEDELVLTMGALEALLTRNEPELSFKLSSRLATLVLPPGPARAELVRLVRSLYKKRSRIVHGEHKPSDQDITIEEDIRKVQLAAREAILTLVGSDTRQRNQLLTQLDYGMHDESRLTEIRKLHKSAMSEPIRRRCVIRDTLPSPAPHSDTSNPK